MGGVHTMNKKIITMIISAIFISLIAVGCNSLNSTEKKYLGNWQDINDSQRFAKIYSDDKGGYTWEDNEDKYPAKFENKILKVQVDKDVFATVTYDESTKHLKATLQDENYEFIKK